jgi:2-polyprenyl-3-methyl-5-hydroxy-6-metoxy-1,4-benzoquinol methylase
VKVDDPEVISVKHNFTGVSETMTVTDKRLDHQGLLDEEVVRELWNDNAADWSLGVSQEWDYFRANFHDIHFVPLLGKLSGTQVIDLGCGEGCLARRMAMMGAQVVGVDISDELISLARKATSESLDITFIQSTISDLSKLVDSKFNLATCVMVLMDTPSLEPIFREAARVLLPGGRLVFSVTHPIWDRSEMQWVDSDPVPVLQISDYFSSKAWIDEWSFCPPLGQPAQSRAFRIATFPHTISDYFNAAASAGFHLQRVLEPKPTMTGNSERDLVLARWQRIPFYLIASFIKS